MNEVQRGPSGKGQVLAKVSGQTHFTLGSTTGMRLSEAEDWKVPSDHRGASFEEWWNSYEHNHAGYGAVALDAWRASITHHTATLRRVGWLDQKGRVWTEVPAGPDFDGGSLTPLLVDVRGD